MLKLTVTVVKRLLFTLETQRLENLIFNLIGMKQKITSDLPYSSILLVFKI